MDTHTVGPTPPSLVSESDGSLRPGMSAASTAALPARSKVSATHTAAPVAPRESSPASTTLGLAQFQQKPVDTMRDPTV